MMPLSLAGVGDLLMVARIGGSQEDQKHLEDLGFVVGTILTVVQQTGDGNIIVNVRESRLAITSQIASKIMVVPKTNE